MRLSKYPAYKDGGNGWLAQVPSHWAVVSLARLINVESGEMIQAADLTNEGFPVFSGNGFRGFFHSWNTEPNTILVGRYGALCGNVRIAPQRLWATEHAFRVISLKSFDTTYMARVLEALDLNQFSSRTAQPGLNSRIVRDNPCPVPPLDEQRAIARYLDTKTGQIESRIFKMLGSTTDSKAAPGSAVGLFLEYRTALITLAVTGQIDVRSHDPAEIAA